MERGTMKKLMKNDIAKIRKKKGLNKSELARAAQITRFYLTKLESGEQVPTVGVVVRIAKALDVSPPYKLYPQLGE
jgi:transcriptional regulator with XRE-family HTH domain